MAEPGSATWLAEGFGSAANTLTDASNCWTHCKSAVVLEAACIGHIECEWGNTLLQGDL